MQATRRSCLNTRKARPLFSRLLEMKAALAVLLCLMVTLGAGARAEVVAGHLAASLDTGSLAGTKFPVSFSYDASQVTATGDSFISLTSFDFTLRGVQFTRRDIFQGGQV